MILSVATKKNGFPNRYSYTCGNGRTFALVDDSVSIFEDDSHNCFNVKAMVQGERIWRQYFHVDGNSTRLAEKEFNTLKNRIVKINS